MSEPASSCEDGQGRPVTVLCVLCGLPAAGKTTLVHHMRERLQASHGRLSYVGFDEIETVLSSGDRDGQEGVVWSVECWKESRRRAFEEADKLLEGPSEPIHHKGGAAEGAGLPERPRQQIVVLDDNMYYRSMRREAFKLAARRSAGFALVYVQVPLDTALQRNAGRDPKQRVTEDIIRRMHRRFEPPDADKARWEAAHVIIQDAEDGPSLDCIFQLLEQASKSPAMIRTLDEEAAEAERAAGRLITRNSMVHQIDIFLRKVINGAMKSQKPPDWQSPSPQDLARMLNEARQSELEKLRMTEGHSHMTESDYDVLKTTVSRGFVETVTSAADSSPGKCTVRRLLEAVLLLVNEQPT